MTLAGGKTFIFCCLKVMILLLFSFKNNLGKNTKKNASSIMFYGRENAMKLTADLIPLKPTVSDTWPPWIASSNKI